MRRHLLSAQTVAPPLPSDGFQMLGHLSCPDRRLRPLIRPIQRKLGARCGLVGEENGGLN